MTCNVAKRKRPKKYSECTPIFSDNGAFSDREMISPTVATLKSDDFCEWLTPYCQETSKKLLSCIKTDSEGYPLVSSDGYVNEDTRISWTNNKSYIPQNKNSHNISWPLFTSSVNPKKPQKPMRSRKVRIKPTSEQAQILRFWMSAHRKTYNEALRLVKDKKAKVNSCLLYTSPSPRDGLLSRMPSSA